MADTPDSPAVPLPQDPTPTLIDNVLELLKSKFLAGLIAIAGFPVVGAYASREYDYGSVTGTATINWANGNVQYVTMTGATTLTFTSGIAGMRCLLHVAGAYTPTFPSSVRWPAGTTPTPTASAGHKDIYTFVYSPKEGLYDGAQAANYATT
jgi:hypothetical protein